MRKEPIIAIVIGSLVGLGVAFFVWRYTNSLASKTDKTKQEQIQDNDSVPETISSDKGISLVTPNELDVFSKSPITVSGIANKGSIITIANPEDILMLKADSSGEFSQELKLGGGYETINVWSFDNQIQSSAQVDVLYSTKLSEEDSDKIVKRTAMLGTVTEISEDTIQIKTPDDLIEQISVSDKTTYSNIISDPEEIEFSEVAIGDFIISLGIQKDSVHESDRILVSKEPTKSNLVAVFGKIKELSSSEFIVTHADGNDYSIDAKGKIEVTKFDENGDFVRAKLNEASPGERIIIIGELGDEVTAKRIHIFLNYPY